MRRIRRIAMVAVLPIGGALLAVGVGRAEAPAKAPASGSEIMPPPAVPNLGAVKDVVKDTFVGTAPGPGGAPVAEGAPAPSDPGARAAALRRKALREQDFVDNDESNRDPFKSFLRLFVDKGTPKTRQVPAVFEKFALEELNLIAIISGDPQPRAMFRDPAGLGQTVKRGDYLSKSAARVAKILSDRVILELSETAANGEARPIEKAILVNPEEEAKQR